MENWDNGYSYEPEYYEVEEDFLVSIGYYYSQDWRNQVQANYKVNKPELIVGAITQQHLSNWIYGKLSIVNVIRPDKIDCAPKKES